MSNRAWVTLATNDSYGLGALVLAHSLRRAGSAYPAVVLITPSVTEAMRDRLRAVFAEVIVVDVLDSGDAAHLALLQRPELGITFTKIHCWNLVQYEKCVFLDADTLVVQNCDELFEREQLSAAPDVGWPDCFNSGVFVYTPSADTFSQLITFAQERGSFDGGDQGLLNSFFADWARGDISKHLPFIYNVTSAAFYSYLPALKHYGQDLKIIHFIGAAKPWLQQFNFESGTVDAPEHIRGLLQLWWDLFASQVHPQLDTSMVEVEEAQEALPTLPPHDVSQQYHYQPTVDPESEFAWHHPNVQNAFEDKSREANIDLSQFHDPWHIYRGNIPANVDDATSHHSEFARVKEQDDIRKYAWKYQVQQVMNAHLDQQQQKHHSYHDSYQQYHYLLPVHNQNYDNHTQDTEQYLLHDTHSERKHEHQYYYKHQSHDQEQHPNHTHHPHQSRYYDQPQYYDHNHYRQINHEQHSYPPPIFNSSHIQNDSHHPHNEDQMHKHEYCNHLPNFQSYIEEQTHKHKDYTHTYNSHIEDQTQQYEEYIHTYNAHIEDQTHKYEDYSHTNKSHIENQMHKYEDYSDTYKSYIEDQTQKHEDYNHTYTKPSHNILESFSQDGNNTIHQEINKSVHLVQMDNERTCNQHAHKIHRIQVANETKRIMNADVSDTESENYSDVMPRHPYDGYYLRHKTTINSYGRKICTHEVPPTPPPSLPLESPAMIKKFPIHSEDADSATNSAENHSGVAGNLARVLPGAAGQREALDELTRRQGWEAGNIDYMGADSFENIWARISQTLSKPRQSPPKQSPPREVVPPTELEPIEVQSAVVAQESPAGQVEVVKEALPGEASKLIETVSAVVSTEVPMKAPTPVESFTSVEATTPVPVVCPPASAEIPVPVVCPTAPEEAPIPVVCPPASEEIPVPVVCPTAPIETPVPAVCPPAPAETPVPVVCPPAPVETPVPVVCPPAPIETAVPVVCPPAPAETPVPVVCPTAPAETPVPAVCPPAPAETPVPVVCPIAAAETPIPAVCPPVPEETPVPVVCPTAPAETSILAVCPPAPAETPVPVVCPAAPVETPVPVVCPTAPAETPILAVCPPAPAETPVPVVCPAAPVETPVPVVCPPAPTETPVPVVCPTAPVEHPVTTKVVTPAETAPKSDEKAPAESPVTVKAVAPTAKAVSAAPKKPVPSDTTLASEAPTESVVSVSTPAPIKSTTAPVPTLDSTLAAGEPVKVAKQPVKTTEKSVTTKKAPAPSVEKVETQKKVTVETPVKTSKVAEPVASPTTPEKTSLEPESDSPPLAHTPTKGDVPVVTAAKSEERRKPAGKLKLVPPAAADPLPTPDSELEDAAALAQSIIASELRTPTVTSPPPPAAAAASPPPLAQETRLSVEEPEVPTPPIGAVSLAQIGVKPTKGKSTIAAQIESSVTEKVQPATTTSPEASTTPAEPVPAPAADVPKKKVVKKVVKKEGAGGEAPVPPPRKKEKKPKEK